MWYFLPTLEVHTPFYFIPNRKYGSFLKFWAPSQLHRTKSRLCGCLQSLRRNQISKRFDVFDAFDAFHASENLSILALELQKSDFSKNSWSLRMARFCRMIFLWSSFDRFWSILFGKNKIYEKIVFFTKWKCSWCFTNAVIFTKPIKNRVLEWCILYFLADLKVSKHFCFIPNK